MKWYTTRDAASLLGRSPSWVRAFARTGLLEPERGPGNQYRFSFQDLVLLRTAAGLQAAAVPPARVRRALERLKRELPQGRPLSALRIVAEPDGVVVHDGERAWNPLSGQYRLDFSVAELGERVAPLAGRATREALAARLGADDWYALGLDLEAFAPVEARHAYDRALELEPGHADAHVNLGRLLHDRGEKEAAEAHYRAALAGGPHATAAYNLGVVLEDRQRLDEAAVAYRQAIAWEPNLSDAHYNLARLLERRGEPQAALRHLTICKRLVESGRRGGPSTPR